MKIGFIGCGNMGGALAKAVAKTNNQLMLADFCLEKAKALAKELNCEFGTNQEVFSSCDMVFLGVKPQVMEQMLAPEKELICQRKPILVSMAAGLEIATIGAFSCVDAPIIRIMPNTCVTVGEGMVLYCVNSLVTDEIEKAFVGSLSFAGKLDKIPENLMDAGCSVSGCGPAYMYMYLEALADGAVACGLPREKAIKYAAQTMLGSAKMVLVSGKHPELLKDEVCSPAGSTIEGVKALEDGCLRACAINAVNKAYKRNKELGKK